MNKSSSEYGSEYSYKEQNTVWNTSTQKQHRIRSRIQLEYAAEYSHTEQNTVRIQLPKSSIEYAVEYSKNTLHHDTEYDVFT